MRTRIAPSPTGDPHVGTAYIALFNYCLARAHGGEFILRIEDTDQARSSRASEEQILNSLRWLGLEWDEGPDIGGPYGPYRQSERTEIYQAHIQPLLESGEAFHCFCTADRLSQLRKEQMAAKSPRMGYDAHCLALSAEEVQARLEAGEEHVIRLKVPREGKCVIDDALREKIEIAWDEVDMQVLIKSDGLPTYHFANVVDDHLMGITHVMRGEEWISSAPKHLLLYKALGWEPPELIHLPLLRNPDKSKLSKRKNPTSILYYQRMGFLPEALLNYLGRMAWSMPDEEEKFGLSEMMERFTLDRISLGGPIFDQAKLSWLNGRWIREELDDETFAERTMAWALNSDYMKALIPLVKVRAERLSDLGPMVSHFFAGLLDLSPEALSHKKLDPKSVQRVLIFAQWQLEASPAWEAGLIEEALKRAAGMLGLKLREFLRPLFIAISGKAVSTPLYQSMEILGKDLSLMRIRQAAISLGPVGKKAEKRLKKSYDAALKALAASE